MPAGLGGLLDGDSGRKIGHFGSWKEFLDCSARRKGMGIDVYNAVDCKLATIQMLSIVHILPYTLISALKSALLVDVSLGIIIIIVYIRLSRQIGTLGPYADTKPLSWAGHHLFL